MTPHPQVWDREAGKWVPAPTVEEIVERALRAARAAGLLPQRPKPVPEPARPQRGPRRCPQRNPRKRVLKGPRSRQRLRSGQYPPKVSTMPRMAGLQEEPSTISGALTL